MTDRKLHVDPYGQTESLMVETDTLTLRGLEEPVFQLCCCVSFCSGGEIGFGFTYYLSLQSTIQLWCCVSFFASGGKQFFVLRRYLVYNTVVRLCQFFCCGRKANLVQIFLLNPNFLLVHKNKVSVTVYLFLALYGSTIIQSQLCLKNIQNFV